MVNHPNRSKKKKLPAAEQHQRFVEMAKEVGASEKPQDFDKAFSQLTAAKNSQKPQ